MSILYQRKRRKKTKYPRSRVSRKVIHRQRIKKKILKSRGWKLNYPDLYELIEIYPYIVKKGEK